MLRSLFCIAVVGSHYVGIVMVMSDALIIDTRSQCLKVKLMLS